MNRSLCSRHQREGGGEGRFQSTQSTEELKSFGYVLKVQIEERYKIYESKYDSYIYIHVLEAHQTF